MVVDYNDVIALIGYASHNMALKYRPLGRRFERNIEVILHCKQEFKQKMGTITWPIESTSISRC